MYIPDAKFLLEIPTEDTDLYFLTSVVMITKEDLTQIARMKFHQYDIRAKKLVPVETPLCARTGDIAADSRRFPRLVTMLDEFAAVIRLVAKEEKLVRAIRRAEIAGEPTDELETELDDTRTDLGVTVSAGGTPKVA